MRDAQLLKISFLVSAFGLVLLYFVAAHSQPAVVKISEIDYDTAGSKVIVEGQIVSKSVHKDGHIFLKISDGTGKISVVLFSGTSEQLDASCIQVGSNIRAVGKVEEYRGSLEVIPRGGNDVRCWKSSPLP
jgi:DNA/RNA endonuclease YhcR with UshA esterase domain